jgi:Cyclic nucleotide-binding domain
MRARDHVGFTSTITDADRPALTRKLEKFRGAPGFTGKAPGGPSRWSTERSGEWEGASYGDVVVISFLAAMDGGRSLNYPAKQKVYAQGDPADSVFYVQEGKLKVVVVLRRGRKRSSRWLNSSVRAV